MRTESFILHVMQPCHATCTGEGCRATAQAVASRAVARSAEETAERWRRQAAKLSQAAMAVSDAIDQRRGKTVEQVVRIEKVDVSGNA